jgi:hypothetical protein
MSSSKEGSNGVSAFGMLTTLVGRGSHRATPGPPRRSLPTTLFGRLPLLSQLAGFGWLILHLQVIVHALHAVDLARQFGRSGFLFRGLDHTA